MNNGTFFLRNKGMRKQKARSDRVHKNSMEEWELRLNGSKIRKQWKSAVDRIIEKKELKLKNVDIAIKNLKKSFLELQLDTYLFETISKF